MTVVSPLTGSVVRTVTLSRTIPFGDWSFADGFFLGRSRGFYLPSRSDFGVKSMPWPHQSRMERTERLGHTETATSASSTTTRVLSFRSR